MKTFLMLRGGTTKTIREWSLCDIAKLLLGREIEMPSGSVHRARLPYELFNLSAPAQKIIDGDQDNLRKEN